MAAQPAVGLGMEFQALWSSAWWKLWLEGAQYPGSSGAMVIHIEEWAKSDRYSNLSTAHYLWISLDFSYCYFHISNKCSKMVRG
jgi:hypothetical protein